MAHIGRVLELKPSLLARKRTHPPSAMAALVATTTTPPKKTKFSIAKAPPCILFDCAPYSVVASPSPCVRRHAPRLRRRRGRSATWPRLSRKGLLQKSPRQARRHGDTFGSLHLSRVHGLLSSLITLCGELSGDHYRHGPPSASASSSTSQRTCQGVPLQSDGLLIDCISHCTDASTRRCALRSVRLPSARMMRATYGTRSKARRRRSTRCRLLICSTPDPDYAAVSNVCRATDRHHPSSGSTTRRSVRSPFRSAMR